jgi:hypothetical protein
LTKLFDKSPFLVIGLAFVSWVLPWPAFADSPQLRLKDGIRLMARGEASDAIVLLSELSPKVDDPKLQGQVQLYLGLAHIQNGSVIKAEKALTFALICYPSIRLDPARFKSQLIKRLEEVRAQPRGRLAIQGEANALVLIDGVPVGRLPVTLRLPLGEQALNIRFKDRSAKVVRVNVQADKRIVVDLREENPPTPVSNTSATKPIPTTAAPTTQQAERRAVKGPVKLGAVNKVPVKERVSFWGRKRVWTWVLLGAAAGAGIAGLGLYANAGALQDDILQQGRQLNISQVEGQSLVDALSQYPYLLDAHNKMETQDTAAVALGIGAGVLAIGSAVLLFLEGAEDERSSKQSRVNIAPVLGQVTGFSLSVDY